EPLYANGVVIPGHGAMEVVYVATEHDSVYAFDATGAIASPLWHVSFLNAKAKITSVPSQRVHSNDIAPEIGITGTPVIDPTSNTLYVASETLEKNTIVQRLHAMDLSTGAEKFGAPIAVSATTPGTASDGDGQNITFAPALANQRCGLALNNGIVYVTYASHGDVGAYHGWILGYDAATLAQVIVFAVTPNATLGGTWMAGDAPMIDADGNVFVVTGNGDFDAPAGIDYGDSMLKLGPGDISNFDVLDYFTPYDQQVLDGMDLDFGSSGVIALPDQPTAPQHLAFTGSKEGTLYLIDRDNMGHFHANDDSQIAETVTGQIGGVYSTPAYFNGSLYVGSIYDNLVAFSFAAGQFSQTPTSQTNTSFTYSGTVPVISANGSQNGIVWAIENAGNAVLHAYNAGDLSQEYYNSVQRKKRDAMTKFVKFTVPTVANGRVFVGSSKRLTAFGLLKSK
ncbi:MAG TPA: hypothetical protein VMT64_08690, partial [Candidatus Binataceae bacterium]|nr:hypothetical protein [Candidatus Binataceae bacterium]